jgi:transcriptional regulator with XRE-family HTH domain
MSLAANIRTRRAYQNWSQKELAQRAGVSQQLINALEAERVRSSKFIREIAMALGCAISDLDPNYGGMAEDGGSIVNGAGRHGDLPIFGAAELEIGSVVVSEQSIDFIDRPEPLLNVRGGYGLIVASNFMFPEFEIGDFALVNPHLPPVPETTCIFYSDEKQQTFGRIRRLIAVTPQSWTVKAWQPAEGFDAISELPRDIWQKCHRIIGRYCRR